MIEKTFLNSATNKQWRIEIDGHTIRTCLNGGKVKEILCDSAFQVKSKAASAMMGQMRKGFVYQNPDAAVGEARCHRFIGKDSNCSGVYLSPNQVLQILRDLEQEPKVLEDLEKHWSDGQFAVLKKALTAAAELGTGLLEATEVVEPNPLHPNESTCYSNLFHCDRDGVYLYIDMAIKQIAQAMEQNKSDP